MYNKLFTKILDSSIWLESQSVRLVWITFIACMDQDGIVQLASIGNVANRARVSETEAEEAIKCLENPDDKNPDQEYEGRRIERIAGVGWFVLNAQKYRDIIKSEHARELNRVRVAKHRMLKKEKKAKREIITVMPVMKANDSVMPSEAYSEDNKKRRVSVKTDTCQLAKKNASVTRDIFDYWVMTFSKNPKTTKFTAKRIAVVKARLKEGYTKEDIYKAIEGCKLSPYHNGENEQGMSYNDLELICRSGEKVEKFRDIKDFGLIPKEKGNAKSRLYESQHSKNIRETDELIRQLRDQ